MLEAGKLESLNYLGEGCSVLHANGMVGYVDSVMESCTGLNDEISKARLSIRYPCGGGSSFHTYRHDGRSHHEAGYDIVRYIESWQSKVKSIRVWSNETLDFEMLKMGNDVAMLAKLYVDTQKDKRTRMVKPREREGFMFTWNLSSKGALSVKVWRVKKEDEF